MGIRWDMVSVVIGLLGTAFAIGMWTANREKSSTDLFEEIEMLKSDIVSLQSKMPTAGDLVNEESIEAVLGIEVDELAEKLEDPRDNRFLAIAENKSELVTLNSELVTIKSKLPSEADLLTEENIEELLGYDIEKIASKSDLPRIGQYVLTTDFQTAFTRLSAKPRGAWCGIGVVNKGKENTIGYDPKPAFTTVNPPPLVIFCEGVNPINACPNGYTHIVLLQTISSDGGLDELHTCVRI